MKAISEACCSSAVDFALKIGKKTESRQVF